ncbi:MAG: carbohydrate kinase [Opitutales bacterium]
MMDTVQNHLPPVYCFGEVLWDCFPDLRRAGGAPFNVAAHLAKLGMPAALISAVGADDLGDELFTCVEAAGVGVESVARHADLPTGTVQVQLDALGQPRYEILEPVAWDRIPVTQTLLVTVAGGAALVFGSLATRSLENRSRLNALLQAASKAKSWRIFDVNLRPPHDDLERVAHFAQQCDFLKLNADELAHLTQVGSGEAATQQAMERLMREYNLRAVLVTLGAQGAAFLDSKGFVRAAGPRIQVVDTVGASDAFLAAYLQSMLLDPENYDRQAALHRANHLAGWVASQAGAVPDYPRSSLFTREP